jgi:pantetheine-phosphate adenylyltransferase
MKTIAIYPGSFNPLHVGHLNIIKKSERIFGKGNVIVAIGINPDKVDKSRSDEYLRSKEAEARVISEKIGVEVVVYSKFLHQLVESYELLAKSKGEELTVVVIRGLRNGTDLDYEVNQLRFVSDFKKDMNVVYITCDKEFEHISSSAIRKIEEFGGYEMSKQYLVI